MRCINNYILVDFIEDRTKIDLGNGHTLYKPERFTVKEDTGEGSLTQKITDRKMMNPQVVLIVSENPKYPQLKKGQKAFVHYGAWETGLPHTDTQSFINADMVFFLIDECDRFTAVLSTYLGERVYSDAPRSESGLYLTPWAEKKEPNRIRITHSPTEHHFVQPGDIALTVDDAQNEVEYNGKKIIVLKEMYVVGKLVKEVA